MKYQILISALFTFEIGKKVSESTKTNRQLLHRSCFAHRKNVYYLSRVIYFVYRRKQPFPKHLELLFLSYRTTFTGGFVFPLNDWIRLLLGFNQRLPVFLSLKIENVHHLNFYSIYVVETYKKCTVRSVFWGSWLDPSHSRSTTVQRGNSVCLMDTYRAWNSWFAIALNQAELMWKETVNLTSLFILIRPVESLKGSISKR